MIMLLATNGWIGPATGVLLVITSAAMLGGLWRLWRGPTMADRVVAMDLMVITALSGIVLMSIMYDLPALVDIAIVLALIAFIATVAFAWYIERSEA